MVCHVRLGCNINSYHVDTYELNQIQKLLLVKLLYLYRFYVYTHRSARSSFFYQTNYWEVLVNIGEGVSLSTLKHINYKNIIYKYKIMFLSKFNLTFCYLYDILKNKKNNKKTMLIEITFYELWFKIGIPSFLESMDFIFYF